MDKNFQHLETPGFPISKTGGPLTTQSTIVVLFFCFIIILPLLSNTYISSGFEVLYLNMFLLRLGSTSVYFSLGYLWNETLDDTARKILGEII